LPSENLQDWPFDRAGKIKSIGSRRCNLIIMAKIDVLSGFQKPDLFGKQVCSTCALQ
jgi:hypothetical protein